MALPTARSPLARSAGGRAGRRRTARPLAALPFWLLALALALALAPGAAARQALSDPGSAPARSAPDTPGVPGVKPLPGYSTRFVPPPARAASPQASVFQITWAGSPCGAPPTGAPEALIYAANIWSALITTTVPIRVGACWTPIADPDVLATGGPGSYALNFAAAPMADTHYAIPLASALARRDLAPGVTHIGLTFDSEVPWSFSTTSAPPAGQFDFVTVAVHELGHGLGFLGWMYESYSIGFCGYASYYPNSDHCPTPYDRFAVDSADTPLLSYLPAQSDVLGARLESDANQGGPNARRGNAAAAVKLYTPGQWTDSSYLHLDTSVAGGQAIMKAGLSPGERIHNLSQPELGIMRDMGWPLAGSTFHIQESGPLVLAVGHVAGLLAYLDWPGYANQPVTYAWQATDKAPVSHPGRMVTDTLTLGWSTPGYKLVSATATGASAADSDTRAVLVFEVGLSGAVKGRTNRSYTFSAAVAPDNTPQHVTYRWQASGQGEVTHAGLGVSDAMGFKWLTGGSKTITVTATIAGEAAVATHTINIAPPVYLPLVARQ